jgi:hypothetical protein
MITPLRKMGETSDRRPQTGHKTGDSPSNAIVIPKGDV